MPAYSKMTHDADHRPNRVPWPPLVLFLLIAAALAAGTLAPISSEAPTWLRIAGLTVCAAGAGLDFWAILTMRRHRTTVLPHRGANRLVTSGPFSRSRNPIYVGNTVLLSGLALVLANPYFIAAAVLNVILVGKLAIEREEAHLATRFGDAWRDYAARVPRWIGPIGRS